MTYALTRPTWQRLGAWAGGAVLDLALSPYFTDDRLALAATAAGLYRSTDRGLNWQRCATALADPSFLAVAVAPASRPGEVRAYVASESGRIFTSTDGGLTWHELSGWTGLGQATQLIPSPGFAIDQTLFAATDEGVLRTQDGGRSWESAIFGLHDLAVLCLAIAPNDAASAVVWCGTAGGGFYRSRNAARSWRDSGQGLPDDVLTALLVSPTFAEDQTLYVGTAESGLFYSTDGGGVWRPRFTDLAGEVITSLAAVDGRLLLGTTAGLFFSADQGHHWQPASGAPIVATILVAGLGGLVLAATPDGIYRSTDGGQKWQTASQGLVAHAPPVVQRLPGSALLALDREGLLALSSDGGSSWQRIDEEISHSGVTAVAVAEEPTRLFVATAEGELFATGVDEAVRNWEACAIEAPEGQLFQQILALGDEADRRLILAATDGQLYRWDYSGILAHLSAELPWAGATLLQLAPSPTFAVDRGLVAITTQPNQQGNYGMQAWESFDGGEHWQSLASFESEAPAVALAWPHDPLERSLLLATRNRIMRIFRPGGEDELALAQHFLDQSVRITALAVSPAFAADRRLWAATSAGVFASTDAGATWARLGEELADRVCVGVFPVSSEGEVLAIELGGTIWQCKA